MNLYLASDHGGFHLKEHLINYLVQKNIAFQNLGVKTEEKSDYPDITKLLVEEVLKDKTNKESEKRLRQQLSGVNCAANSGFLCLFCLLKLLQPAVL